MKFYTKITIIALFLIELSSSCKTNPTLKLDSLIKEVVKNNPSLAATQDRITAASLAADRARIPDDPRFVYRAIGNQTLRQTEFAKERRYKFQQRIHFPGKLRLRKEIKLQDLAFMESREIKTHNDLVLQTKVLYYSLYFNHTSQQINQQNKKIVSRFIDSASAQYKTGKGMQADILKAQVEMQVLNDEIVMLKSEEDAIKAMINAVLNKPQKKFVGKPESVFHESIKFDYKKTEEMAMGSRPELIGQKALVKREKKTAKLARRNYFPDLYFEVMIQRRPRNEKFAWGINLGFDIPIWARQKQKRESDEAESKALAGLFELQDMKNNIRANIESLLAQIEAFDIRINLYKTAIIPKTTKTLESNEANYKVGKGSFLDIIDTRRQLHNVELIFEDARIKKEIWLAKLENEVGVSIEKIIENAKL